MQFLKLLFIITPNSFKGVTALKFKTALLISVSILFFLTSCSTNKQIKNLESEQITYTNLSGENSINTLKNILQNKISETNLNSFLNDVIKYNSVVKDLADDFTTSNEVPVNYDMYKIITEIQNNFDPNFVGNNCRITTFELMKDFIDLNIKREESQNLIFDNDSIKYQKKFNDDDFYKFNTFYKTVITEPTKDINRHVESMKKYFDEINLKFNLLENLSIISVVFHDDLDNPIHKLFVGHTGVLIEENGEFYFIEKLSLELPYQVVKFRNKEELNEYLMKTYDTSWEQTTAKPFILENLDLMKEYKPLTKEQ